VAPWGSEYRHYIDAHAHKGRHAAATVLRSS